MLDTNVLYGQFSRYMFLSLAVQGVLLPFWSPAILDELTGVLTRGGFDAAAIDYQRRKIESDWPESLVSAPLPPVPPDIALGDPDDWAVIATAILARAPTILTWNCKDFPRAVLEPYGVAAWTPDRWCAEGLTDLQHAGAADDVYKGLRGHLATLRRPAPWTPEQYHDMLRREGYHRFAALIPLDALR